MKRALTTLTAIAVLGISQAFAQGPLAPPAGAPAPSMKTLDQIEARIAIEALPYTISAAGSYYLAKNLQFTAASGDAVSITAPNVTLDLNGFALSSTAGVTGNAIKISNGLNNIAIKNGIIAGNTTVSVSGSSANLTWTVNAAGFANGLIYLGGIMNLNVENIQVSGCRQWGLYTNSGTVTHVSATTNNGGIYVYEGVISGCTAKLNGGTGFQGSTIIGCTSNANNGYGMLLNDFGCVTNSRVYGNSLDGIRAHWGNINGCSANSNNASNGPSYYDINADYAVIAFTRYGTGLTTNSTLTGNYPASP